MKKMLLTLLTCSLFCVPVFAEVNFETGDFSDCDHVFMCDREGKTRYYIDGQF